MVLQQLVTYKLYHIEPYVRYNTTLWVISFSFDNKTGWYHFKAAIFERIWTSYYEATNLHSHDQHTDIRHATYFYNILSWFYLGAMIGLFVTSICLSIWTEVGNNAPEDISGTDDPNWVGAWWIMFTVGFGLTLLCSLPMFGFPKQLPGDWK